MIHLETRDNIPGTMKPSTSQGGRASPHLGGGCGIDGACRKRCGGLDQMTVDHRAISENALTRRIAVATWDPQGGDRQK